MQQKKPDIKKLMKDNLSIIVLFLSMATFVAAGCVNAFAPTPELYNCLFAAGWILGGVSIILLLIEGRHMIKTK